MKLKASALILLLSLFNHLQAGIAFSDDFNDGALGSHLDNFEGTFAETGGQLKNIYGTRSTIRTSDSDYISNDFIFESTITISSTEIAFMGMGTGAQDPNLSNEPFGAYLRMHDSTLVGGRVDLVVNSSPLSGFEFVDYGFGNFGNGTHRVRSTLTGSLLTFDIDQHYNGTFNTDASSSVDLSLFSFNSTNSHLFVGTSTSGAAYDDMLVSVSAVPEPASLSLLLLSCGSLAFFRRKRKIV
ncbi:MAG: PEP-CTERM sorting domain-containing protein [Planctomycetes bacterium]|nr:PEP-CTERM sorting domain-containing protein [Planctomycetota bacterium]